MSAGVDGPEPPAAGATLDPLVRRVLDTYPYRFTVPRTDDERRVAYRIRAAVVAAEGWAEDPPAAEEHDVYDVSAVHVVGWSDDEPVSTGRIVLPPGPLPTEDACALVVEPRGRVVDVGRMAVLPGHQDRRAAAFVALLCRLYLEVRERGYGVACGMMSPRARTLVRMLGLRVELLGPDRPYWHEQRAPVRFELTANVDSLTERWEG